MGRCLSCVRVPGLTPCGPHHQVAYGEGCEAMLLDINDDGELDEGMDEDGGDCGGCGTGACQGCGCPGC